MCLQTVDRVVRPLLQCAIEAVGPSHSEAASRTPAHSARRLSDTSLCASAQFLRPCVMSLFPLALFCVLIALLGWVAYRFLLVLPAVDPPADRAFLRAKTVWITGASSGIGKGHNDSRLAFKSISALHPLPPLSVIASVGAE